MVTVFMISRMTLIDAMRATPPSLRISDGTRSKAITAQAPAFSAILACSAFVTSMITPPFSISARPTFTRHSFEPLLPLPLPFGFFPSIFFLLSYVKLSKFLILDTDAPARTVLQSCGSRCPARRSVSSEERSPPQPQHWLVGFGSSPMVSLKLLLAFLFFLLTLLLHT